MHAVRADRCLGKAFAGICRAIQQALAFPVGADRLVFLCAVPD